MKRRSLAGAAIAVAALLAYREKLKPWHERWGATDEEVGMRLPGDELIAEPAAQITRGITIDAAPERVWPWVIQIGADRGGFYSYDWLENIFGLDIHSADVTVPEWQQRSVGDLMHADEKGGGGWYVMEVRPNEALVVEMANVKESRPWRRGEWPFMEFTWTFALQAEAGRKTRLLVRERVGFGNRLSQFMAGPVGLISFVMTQKMMRGIKERAESRGHDFSSLEASERELIAAR